MDEMTTVPRRIFLECTRTCFVGGNSGIQRVTRNLVNRHADISNNEVQFLPVVWNGDHFNLLHNPLGERSISKLNLTRVYQYFRSLRGFYPETQPRFYRKPRTFLKSMLANLVRNETFDSACRRIYRILARMSVLKKPIIQLSEGDTVILLDSNYHATDMDEYLLKAQAETGIKIGMLIHDLLPLTHPDTFLESSARKHTDWLTTYVSRADFFITNSATTSHELQQFLDAHPVSTTVPRQIQHFQLGAELDLCTESAKLSNTARAIWELGGHVILSVGTIEPRKNHALLLDAFDHLLGKGLPFSLLIIGQPGWKYQDILNRIHAHPAHGTHLLYFDDASDHELAQAYERADCLVISSLAEGFGLPLVEGLIHGMPVFASDIPVFREIGGKHCVYFSLESPYELATRLEQWLTKKYSRQAGHDEVLPAFSWPDWQESTHQFARIARELSDY